MPSFPSELFDLIIDHLSDSQGHLLLCSTVCKDWLSRSRFHLFHTIKINQRNHLPFSPLILSPLCTISEHVKVLMLSNTRKPHLSNWVHLCIPWIPYLNQVHTFHIYQFNFKLESDRILDALARIMPKITTLKLTSLSFMEFNQLASFISSFPCLCHRLDLQNLGWSNNDRNNRPIQHLPRYLESIFLGRIYKRDILEWILSNEPPPTLCEALRLDPVGPMDVPAIANYLTALGKEGSLRILRFAFSSMDAGGDAEEFSNFVDLSNIPTLEELHIDDIITGASEYRFSSPVPWILKILETIHPSGTLQKLTFSLSLESLGDLDLDEIKWDTLDNILCGLRGLKCVLFRVANLTDLVVATLAIGLKLPLVQQRGILYVKIIGSRV